MRIRRLITDVRGLSAVEFAFAFPVFLILSIGSLELGNMFMTQAGLTYAVNEAARYATIYPTPSQEQIRTRITSRSFGLQSDKLTLNVSPVTNDATYGDFITITASYAATPMTTIVNVPPVTLTETRKVWIPSAT